MSPLDFKMKLTNKQRNQIHSLWAENYGVVEIAVILDVSTVDVLTTLNRESINETVEYQCAKMSNADRWVPACGGTEQQFKTRTGKTLLYCWNPLLHKHAYLDVDSDIILADREAAAAMGD